MLTRKSHPAWVLRASGKPEEALAEFKRAAERLELAWAAMSGGQYEAELGSAVRDQPTPGTYKLGFPDHGIGACLVALGQEEQGREHLRRARDAYKQALKKQRTDDDLLFYLAGTQALLGEKAEALETLARYKRAARFLSEPMKHVRLDTDFASLAQEPAFQELVSEETEEQRHAREMKEQQARATRALELEYRKVSDLDDVLLTSLPSTFRLPKSNLDAAHRTLLSSLEAFRRPASDLSSGFADTLATSGSLAQFLEQAFDNVRPQCDAPGDITGFAADADEWATLLLVLEQVADQVEPGSLLLFHGEDGHYWKVVFDSARMQRWRTRRKSRS
jgi:tetratricopeptide (TPR) repeat protein